MKMSFCKILAFTLLVNTLFIASCVNSLPANVTRLNMTDPEIRSAVVQKLNKFLPEFRRKAGKNFWSVQDDDVQIGYRKVVI